MWACVSATSPRIRNQCRGEEPRTHGLRSCDDRLASYISTKASFPKVWQEASQNVETILWVTPAELEEVTHEVLGIFNRFRDRISDPSTRTEGSLPVEALMFTYPVRLPEGSQ